MRPSFLAQALNGIIATFAILLYIKNYHMFSSETNIQLLFLMSISIGLHALLHHYEEIYYDFNPLIGKWKNRDQPRTF